jgi:hypothetical protein
VVGTPEGQTGGNGGGGLSGGAIAAIIIVPLLVIILIIIIAVCCYKRKRTGKMSDEKKNNSGIPANNPGFTNSTDNVRQGPIFPEPAQYGNVPNSQVNPYPYPIDSGYVSAGSKVKGSPGMADLGVRHISAGNPDLNASIASSLQGYTGPMTVAGHDPGNTMV